MKSEIQSQSIQIANMGVWIARGLRRPKWACFGDCGAQWGLCYTHSPGLQKIVPTLPGFRILGSQSDVHSETIDGFLRQSFPVLQSCCNSIGFYRLQAELAVWGPCLISVRLQNRDNPGLIYGIWLQSFSIVQGLHKIQNPFAICTDCEYWGTDCKRIATTQMCLFLGLRGT